MTSGTDLLGKKKEIPSVSWQGGDPLVHLLTAESQKPQDFDELQTDVIVQIPSCLMRVVTFPLATTVRLNLCSLI